MRLPLFLASAALAGALAAPFAIAANEDDSSTMNNLTQQQDSLYDALLDALYATFGNHPGFRITHAKGVLLHGMFTATQEAATLSRAAHFHGQAVPVQLRFSNFSGLPGTADADLMASPHGLAVRFSLPSGEFTDIVTHSFDGFPVATPEDFLSFLQGIAANVATPPDPLPLQAFLATHPRAQHFLEASKQAPNSYAAVEYFGVNSLVFSNGKGEQRIGRYRIEPLVAEAVLTEQQAAEMPADYLQDEIGKRLARGPVKLRLVVQLAAPGDAVDDGSIPWSRSHQEVELGVLTLNAVVPIAEQQPTQRRLDFNPGRMIDGISASHDPMIQARERIYQRAVQRRQQP